MSMPLVFLIPFRRGIQRRQSPGHAREWNSALRGHMASNGRNEVLRRWPVSDYAKLAIPAALIPILSNQP